METITRIFEFDSAHRVMNERVKCFNLHGHRFRVEATFQYLSTKELGYAIDFKELKRVFGEFIDTFLDHASILNPMDTELIDLCIKNKWRVWVMGLGKQDDINPSAENIASELFYVGDTFFNMEEQSVKLVKIRLYETPNCWVECSSPSYIGTPKAENLLKAWRKSMGEVSYDSRECLKN